MQVMIADTEDIAQWLVLAAEVEALFGPMVGDPKFLGALKRKIDRHTAFCVREADQPAGAPLIGGLVLSPKPPLYTIGWLVVSQRHRRRGVGRMLVEHVINFVTPPAEFAVTTFGDDSADGIAARLFYESLGFSAAEAAEGPKGEARQMFRRRITSASDRVTDSA